MTMDTLLALLEVLTYLFVGAMVSSNFSKRNFFGPPGDELGTLIVITSLGWPVILLGMTIYHFLIKWWLDRLLDTFEETDRDRNFRKTTKE
jgi:hypothetical protein